MGNLIDAQRDYTGALLQAKYTNKQIIWTGGRRA